MKQEMSVDIYPKEPESLVPTFILPTTDRKDLISWVVEQTTQSGTMLPKSETEVVNLFAQQNSLMLLDAKGKPIAHGAISVIYEVEHTIEIGGIVVAKDMRNKGLGSQITALTIEMATIKYLGWSKLAFCNQHSLPIFLKLGASAVTEKNAHLIPSEAWLGCMTCPKQSEANSRGKLCCDTVVIIS